jgi:subtilisin-like proprotein convertase family protein
MNFTQQLVIGMALATGASAATVFSDTGLTPPLAIPDHDATGILRSLEVSGLTTGTAYDVDVSLDIEGRGYGGYAGDLYVYLGHQTPTGSYNMVVLLNRPGRSALLPSGYDDAGLNITLSDSAVADIHTYQAGTWHVDGNGVLDGTWQPDRRLANPDTVTNDTERATTTLESIVNGDANGNWYCFVADMESGGTLQLNGWSVSFAELSAVPEPTNALLLSGLISSALFLRSRRRMNAAARSS